MLETLFLDCRWIQLRMPRQVFLCDGQKQTISYKTTYDIRAKGSVHRKCSRISNFHLRLSLLYIYFLYCHITSKLKHVVIGGFPTFIWKTKVLTRISYFYLCQDTVEQEQLLRVFHTYLKANAGHIWSKLLHVCCSK